MMPYPEGPNLNIQKIMQAFMGLTFYNWEPVHICLGLMSLPPCITA
jgi:hypothetical protein